LIKAIDKARLDVSTKLDGAQRSSLGQFMTPAAIAGFMASLFVIKDSDECRLLDPGAGIGSLSIAFLERLLKEDHKFKRIEVQAYEIDDKLGWHLENMFACYKAIADVHLDFAATIVVDDFVERAVEEILSVDREREFTHAVLNPPYKKISSDSNHRFLLRQVGIETVNLYAAFVALALELLQNGGQLVAIIPRSFCNGPYYRQFRNLLLQKSAVRQIHLFDARDKAFKDDEVLQENVIVHLERGGKQDEVIISTSNDDSFSDYTACSYSFNQIVYPDDAECFIHIPTSAETCLLESSPIFNRLLSDLFVEVSTGPIVDFRVKEHIRQLPQSGAVPLLYPGHFVGNSIEYPKTNWKKPNAIDFNSSTEKWLYPNGFYTVVRRFSSKEQKRRIYASVVNPNSFPDSIAIGFENHLNVFHFKRRGISEEFAYGLAAFLNSTPVDQYFRRFNGHTQVNATDLRKLKYPDLNILKSLGRWAKERVNPTQEMIDEKLLSLI
jgi:adenine-specific DNA-methyltransferase